MSKRLTLILGAVLVVALILGASFIFLSSKSAKDHLKEGLKLYQKGKFKQAETELKKATDKDPKLFKAHFLLGRTYESLGKLDQALIEYQEASKLKPKDPEVRYQLGLIYRAKNRLKKAIKEFEKAVKLNPSFTGAWLILGESYFQNKQFDKAIETYNYILRANFQEVDLVNIHLQLGLLYKKKGDKQKAKEELEEVLKKDPENKEAKKLLKEISP